MQHTSFKELDCPVARALECVGEWWSMLIIRDAFLGASRFDEFQQRLGIAPNMLTRRLRTLTESGLLERQQYSLRPPRFRYALTERGRDFFPVLAALGTWGHRHVAPDTSVRVADRETGVVLDPVVVDRTTLAPITAQSARLVSVPAPVGRPRETPAAGEKAARTRQAGARRKGRGHR